MEAERWVTKSQSCPSGRQPIGDRQSEEVSSLVLILIVLQVTCKQGKRLTNAKIFE